MRVTLLPHLSSPPPQWKHHPVNQSSKFLGVYFPSLQSWLPHIKVIKAKSLCALNVLTLPHPCNRGIPLPSHLKLLTTIQNSAIRINTGSFCTSLVISLCADHRSHAHREAFKLSYQISPFTNNSWISNQMHTPSESRHRLLHNLEFIFYKVLMHTLSHPISTTVVHRSTPGHSQTHRNHQLQL